MSFDHVDWDFSIRRLGGKVLVLSSVLQFEIALGRLYKAISFPLSVLLGVDVFSKLILRGWIRVRSMVFGSVGNLRR